MRIKPIPMLPLSVLAGCEQNLLAQIPDAQPAEAPPLDASIYRPTPSAPLAPGKYQLYLNTEGVTLTYGTPNSQTNTSDLVLPGGAVVPPFLDGVAGRQGYIDQIVTAARGVLAPYSIDIVTTRPSAGDYYMFVLGSDSATLIGSAGLWNLTDLACVSPDKLPRDGLALVFDRGIPSTFINHHTVDQYASFLLYDLGFLEGLGGTTQQGDCVCTSLADCTLAAPVCSFGSNVPTVTDTTSNCGITPTEDEPALLKGALGCR